MVHSFLSGQVLSGAGDPKHRTDSAIYSNDGVVTAADLRGCGSEIQPVAGLVRTRVAANTAEYTEPDAHCRMDN